MISWIIVAILLLPLAEIAAFVAVASQIGIAGALLLLIATSLTGAAILRRAGRDGMARFRAATAGLEMAGVRAGGTDLLTVFAGVLLFLPGFLTDVAGAALLLPPVRRWLLHALRRRAERAAPRDTSVVDLKPGEWRQVPDPRIERHPADPPRPDGGRNGDRSRPADPDGDRPSP